MYVAEFMIQPPSTKQNEATERGWLVLGALLRSSRMLVKNPRPVARRGPKIDYIAVDDMARAIGVSRATLGNLEMGVNSNPAAMILKKIEDAGYVRNPQTGEPLNSSDFLAIACEEIEPINPLTGQPFTHQDLVNLKIVEPDDRKTEKPVNHTLHMLPQRSKNNLSRDNTEVFMFDSPPPRLSEVISAWLRRNPSRNWVEYAESKMVEMNVPAADVCLQRLEAIAAGADPRTTHELVFLWFILHESEEAPFDLEAVRQALGLPDYDSIQPDACSTDWRHLVGNGNGQS